MHPYSRLIQWLAWGLLGATILFVAGLFLLTKAVHRTGTGKRLPVYGTVPDFALTNQLGQAVTLADLRGAVWVADIIFTRCAGPCPRMTRQMSELQDALGPAAPVRFITLTTDPEFDTPGILRQYADRFGADPKRWWFLTGEKSEIVRLAIDGLKLTALEKAPEQRENEADLFIHSTQFLVVDGQDRLRAIVESQEPGWRTELLEAIRHLRRER